MLLLWKDRDDLVANACTRPPKLPRACVLGRLLALQTASSVATQESHQPIAGDSQRGTAAQ